MNKPKRNLDPASIAPQRFQTTRWILVMVARGPNAKEAREALAILCEAYWYPLYAFVRRKGYNAEDSLDLVQGFFERLLKKNDPVSVERDKGRLRSFLMPACTHHLSNRLDHERAKKRGGGWLISIDVTAAEGRDSLEPSHELTAERLFEQRWTTTRLALVMGRFEGEMTAAGKSRQFTILQPTLSGNSERGSHVRIAAELGITEEAARTAIHRLRRRLRTLIREEIRLTLDHPADAEEEIRSVFASLGA